MESKWFHCAKSTRNNCWMLWSVLSLLHPQDCTILELLARARTLSNLLVGLPIIEILIWSSPRSVSTSRLQTLLLFHLTPINGCSSRDLTDLCHESTHLEVGFPLRCFQRLSSPHLATQRLPLAR